jgi:hypothetical protein
LNGYKVVVEVPICRTRAPNASYPYVVVTTSVPDAFSPI